VIEIIQSKAVECQFHFRNPWQTS